MNLIDELLHEKFTSLTIHSPEIKKYSRPFLPFTNVETEKIGEQSSFYEPEIIESDNFTSYKTNYENHKAYQEFIDKLPAEQKTSIFY